MTQTTFEQTMYVYECPLEHHRYWYPQTGDGTPRSWRHFYNARCRELIRSMEISDKLLCLFNAELTTTDDGYIVEVPQSEIETGSLESGETYRVALISRDAVESESSESSKSSRSSRPSSEPQPPVEQGETRSVEVEDLGKQGDGIARVERGYVIIVPGAGIGEQVEVEISEVRSNFAVGEVIEETP